MNPIFIIIILLVLIAATLYVASKITKGEKAKLIEELWQNNEISDETYKKYLKKD